MQTGSRVQGAEQCGGGRQGEEENGEREGDGKQMVRLIFLTGYMDRLDFQCVLSKGV